MDTEKKNRLWKNIMIKYLCFISGGFMCNYVVSSGSRRSEKKLKWTKCALASSRRSVSQGAAQQTAREKIKKGVTRGTERLEEAKCALDHTQLKNSLKLP